MELVYESERIGFALGAVLLGDQRSGELRGDLCLERPYNTEVFLALGAKLLLPLALLLLTLTLLFLPLTLLLLTYPFLLLPLALLLPARPFGRLALSCFSGLAFLGGLYLKDGFLKSHLENVIGRSEKIVKFLLVRAYLRQKLDDMIVVRIPEHFVKMAHAVFKTIKCLQCK